MKHSENPRKIERLVVPSDQSCLPKVERFVKKVAKKARLNDDQSDNLAIAVTELVNNGILHGNKLSPDKTVTLEANIFDTHLTVSVTDQGEGFDPDAIANPIDPENLWKLGGRGIFLVKNLIDEVEIYPTPNGTTVTITEYIKEN